MTDYIQRFTARNYGCLRDVTVQLTPLHAFIGPNDSGKSTLLKAVKGLVDFVNGGEQRTGSSDELGILYDPRELPCSLELSWRNVVYSVYRDEDVVPPIEVVSVDGARVGKADEPPWSDARQWLLRGTRMLRLDPDALRAPSALIPRGRRPRLQDERGTGLPGIYDTIINQNVQGFLAIQDEVRRLFPNVKSIGLENVSESRKELQIQLTTGKWIPARLVSEGLLYYLAFAAIPYLDPVAVLLVEEPENGLHPARIAEVMRALREVSKTTQVLIATHSPLVINEMQPEEVSVLTRTPEEGTRATLIKDTPNFEKRSSVYALGELWLSYANGVDEAPLFREGR